MTIFPVRRYPDTPPAITTTQTDPIPQGFVLGVDFGSMSDRTALVVNEWSIATQTTFSQAYAQAEPAVVRRDRVIHHSIRALHRPAIGTAYPAVIEQIKIWLEDLPIMERKTILAADGTGLGGPIVDYLRKERLSPLAIIITGGGTVDITETKASVPKSHLAGCMQVALQTGRLKIAAELPEGAVMLREMQMFKVKISQAGHEMFESGANSVHDDIVLATMLAIWTAENKRPAPTPEEQRAINDAWRARFNR
jgi:hypothetical protein